MRRNLEKERKKGVQEHREGKGTSYHHMRAKFWTCPDASQQSLEEEQEASRTCSLRGILLQ